MRGPLDPTMALVSATQGLYPAIVERASTMIQCKLVHDDNNSIE